MTAAIDRKIADYLAGMNEADRHERSDATVPTNVAAALEALQGRRAKLQAQAAELSREGLKQKVVGEPEAKLMRTPRGHQVAYNAQITVDAKHALVSAFDLTNDGNDEQQLHPMAVQGKAAVGADLVTVVADVGYSNGAHGAACAKDGITAVVPRAETVNTHGQQYFSRNQFSYDATSDSYRCPAGATLNCQVLSDARQRKRYATSACASCPLKPQCTKGVRRLIYRSLHEDDREAMHQRAMSDPVWMKLRRELAEHPFGTIKWLMPRFLLRGLRKAKAELALSVLGYNLKRVINILGTPTLLQVLQPTFR
jgi:hypothetical protein